MKTRNPITRLHVLCLLTAAASLFPAAAAAQPKPYEPRIAAASDEGERAIAAMKAPPGFRIFLWAAEPDVANPVAFSIDEKGRIYVCETFRQGNAGGVLDNRGHMYWLNDDLAAQTVEDRRAMLLKHNKKDVERWTKHHDRIRLLEDTTGAGRADKAAIFSTGYNDLVDGTGAGVLAWQGHVYYTCIPKLYRLADKNGDGVADESQVLADGFGVRVAFRGHDLHGLVMGPDGRIYFTVGDRGYNVTTKEGKALKAPGRGAVFRCEPDGSNLEVVHTGLRNPQELTFDDYGNLFTADNNSDAGDQARWTWIVEGGDSGWDMAFQYLPDRGPWNREGWWHEWPAPGSDPEKAKRHPAFLVPPLKHIGSGPSGITSYTGTGLPAEYDGTFLVSDFRGGAGNSGAYAFKHKPRGAGFEVVDLKQFVWGTLITDIDFAPDGGIYFSDWVNGWEGEGKGRIYRMVHEETSKAEIVGQTKKLLAEGFEQRKPEELGELLKHPDRRVRQGAQFALVKARAVQTLISAAEQRRHQLARLHAIWGLVQLFPRPTIQRGADGAKASYTEQQLELGQNVSATLLRLNTDADSEIRAQSLRALGEVVWTFRRISRAAGISDDNVRGASNPDWVLGLSDVNHRVRYFAAILLGKGGFTGDIDALLQSLRDNADADPYLRHAAVLGLLYMDKPDALFGKRMDPSRSVRIGILLTLRRLNDPRVAHFLNDSDPHIATEAARAIHDMPIEKAWPQLAELALIKSLPSDDALLRRVIAANYLLGGKDRADALGAFALTEKMPANMRIEALKALADWGGASKRDRVLGVHRPAAARPADEAAEASAAVAVALLSDAKADAAVRQAAADLAGHYRLAAAAPFLLTITKDDKQSNWLRVASLKALGTMNDAKLGEAVAVSLSSSDANLRKEARQWLAKLKPAEAVATLEAALEKGSADEQQAAILTLASMKHAAADAVIEKWLDRMLAGKAPAEMTLELLEAATQRNTPAMKAKLAARAAVLPKDDLLAAKKLALTGGDREAGRKVFWENAQASCIRCHKVAGKGAGEAGPDLRGIGKQPREYLLESLLLPSKQIAKGFDTYDVETAEGDRIIGVLREETDGHIILVTPDNKRVTIKKADITDRRKTKSAMPEGIEKLLTDREIRDVVEYLAGLKE